MLDTNTIVSGVVFQGSERHLLHVIYAQGHTLVLSEYVFQETKRVLTRKLLMAMIKCGIMWYNEV